MKTMSKPAPGRNVVLFLLRSFGRSSQGVGAFAIVLAALTLLLTSAGCVKALGDFDSVVDATATTESPDGGTATSDAGGDGGPTGPCSSGAKECKAQDLMVCNGSG